MMKETDFGFSYNPLPAVAIGGPPHSGKSVLAYSLTRALRERSVPHYLLRACPQDGEGDWFHEGEPDFVRRIRVKSALSDRWLPLLRRDIARRHLPLIVDLGGFPSREQVPLLSECTHGILLTPSDEARREWAEYFAACGLILLADLRSDLRGENHLETAEPVVRGTLAGLERGRAASGPVFEALVERLEGLFQPFAADLYCRHIQSAPAELVVDLERLARQLNRDPNNWLPQDLPMVLDYLPSAKPLALYGRGPNWLYAALAVHALPAPFYLFDARLGWTLPPALHTGPSGIGPIQIRVQKQEAALTQVDCFLTDAYVDITDVEGISLPALQEGGIILWGRLPLWLWAALARLYAPFATWLAVAQPQLATRKREWAVVVHSRGVPPIGSFVGL